MSKDRKLLIFVIILAVASICLIIYRYEKLIHSENKSIMALQKIISGASSNKEYTAQEIIDLIKSSPEYLGDTITIFDNGDMTSSNKKFDGTIQAVINSKENMNIVIGELKNNKLPLQVNVYKLASAYYKAQYPSDIPNTK